MKGRLANEIVKNHHARLLVLLLATAAQAGYLTPGLESQLSDLDGDDTIKVLVVMSEQTDIQSLDWELHDAKAGMDVRHRVVLETLQDRAIKTQGDLLASLATNKANGRILGYTAHWIVNAVVVTGTEDAIRELAARPRRGARRARPGGRAHRARRERQGSPPGKDAAASASPRAS